MTPPFSALTGTRDQRQRFAIRQLQFYLRRLTDPGLIQTGVWDSRSAEALSRFQSQTGFPATGRADLASFLAVIAAGKEAQIRDSDPFPLTLPPLLLDGGRLSPGDQGDAVALVQILLNRFLLTLPDTAPLPITSLFTPETASAVRRFRALHALSEGDEIDKPTWNLLTASFSTPASFE